MASRGGHHEEHINHEAWAIPYADLVTLLLAFFVVMYSISSVNEGKFRVVSKSISNAFNGAPTVIEPIQASREPSASRTPAVLQTPASLQSQPIAESPARPAQPTPVSLTASAGADLANVADRVEQSMASLIDRHVVVVRRHQSWIEVEIRADILFPSGVATLSTTALPPLRELARTLSGFANPVHVEGHTDNVPISTLEFPSNWELSAARAARVARLFVDAGVDPHRLSISGLGEFRPEASNDSEDGRNRNRRVKLIVLEDGLAGAVPAELRAEIPSPAALAASNEASAAPMRVDAAAGAPSAP